MRSAVAPAVMTAFVGVAGLLLATSASAFEPFFGLVPRDCRTELPLVAAMLVLATGVAVVGAVARRQDATRADAVSAALVAPVALALAVYLAFELRFWPAFAANRVTYGLDLSHLSVQLAVAGLALHVGLAWVVVRAIARRPPPAPPVRRVVAVLASLTLVTAVLVGLGLRHAQTHPRGYLGGLQRLPLAPVVEAGAIVKTDDLCVFGTGDPRKVDVIVVGPHDRCPASGTGGERLEVRTLLLHDLAHDAWFGPSHASLGDDPYVRQLEGPAGVLTLRDVGAPAPLGLVYLGCIALAVASALGFEGLKRKRAPPLAGVATAALFALPLWVAAGLGVL
jgi:hypothetical protein